MSGIKLSMGEARSMYITHPEASYATFMWNNEGQLFMDGDWGFYCYRWSSFGGITFEDFISGCTVEYVVGKLAINWNNYASKQQRFGGIREKNVSIMVKEFLTHLKLNL